MRFFGIAVLLGLALFGCATQQAKQTERAQVEMVGMSKKALLTCAGNPMRQEQYEDREFLSYGGCEEHVDNAVTASISPGHAMSSDRSSGHRYCEATVILKDGLIDKIIYRSSDGKPLITGERCIDLFEKCLK